MRYTTATVLCLLAAASPAVVGAQLLCPPPLQPATTVPQFRTELPGESIWPTDSSGQVIFQPAEPSAG